MDPQEFRKLFRQVAPWAPRSDRLREDKDVSLEAGLSLLLEKDKPGRLRYVAVNFEDATNLELWIVIDGRIIFNFSHDNLTDTGDDDLAITEADAAGGLIYCGEDGSDGYSLVFDANACPLPYLRSLEIYVKNLSNTDYACNAAYILWDRFVT